jgi:hypothetical protein
MTVIILGIILFAAAFVAGILFGRRGGRWAWAVLAAMAAVVLLKLAMFQFPDIEYGILFSDLYAEFRPWWFYPLTFLFLGMVIVVSRHRATRLTAGALAGAMLLFFGQVGWATAHTDYSRLHGAPDADGVFLQTSGYSCGAAAAATLLHARGYSTNEREMARLCETNSFSGTDPFLICRGLRRYLADEAWRVDMVRADWERLRRVPLPALATVRLSFMVDHWVAILSVHERKIWLGDPLYGRVVWPRTMFERRWGNFLVLLRPDPPAGAVNGKSAPSPPAPAIP